MRRDPTNLPHKQNRVKRFRRLFERNYERSVKRSFSDRSFRIHTRKSTHKRQHPLNRFKQRSD